MLPGGLVLSDTTVLSGRFQLVEQESRRPWGYVFRAHDLRDGRAVRVRVVDPEVVDAAAFEAVLRDENATTFRLAHAGATPLVGAGCSVLGPVVVEEWIDGASLERLLADGPLPVAQACAIGLDLVDALAAAHRGGLVHGSLVAADVHLTGPDGSGPARIGGFGVGPPATVAATGALADAAGGGPPDQRAGERPGPDADRWALGRVLVQALTGRVPVGPGIGIDLGALPPEVPSRLVDVLARTLDPDPYLRPGLDELRGALEAAGGGTGASGSASAAPRGDLPSPPRGLPRWASLSLVGCLLVGVLGVVVVAQGGPPAQAEADRLVPDLAGAPVEEATDLLDDAGLGASLRTQVAPEADEGVVLSQEPAAGATAGAGADVVLVVSVGDGTVAVPDLVGLVEAGAQVRLRDAGLVAEVVVEPAAGTSEGRVVRQSPSPGEPADRNSTVQVVVAG